MLPSAVYGQLGDQMVQVAAAAALAQQQQQQGAGQDSAVHSSRDTIFTKIFVGGLPYHTSDKTLHEYFEQFGDIEEAVVITDRQTQKSRGYGFVTMKDRPAAERACKDPNPIIDGRKANVNLAYLGAKPRNNVGLADPMMAALSGATVQLPLQTQLQALFPARIGLPQLYYHQQAAAGLMNPLLGGAPTSAAQPLLDYQALAQAMAQQHGQAYALAPQVSAAPGLEQYGYTAGYGLVPGSFPLQQAQLAAAQQQLEHQRV